MLAAGDALLVRRVLVRAEREPPRIFSVGRTNLVRLHLHSSARRALAVQVNDDVAPGLVVEGLPQTANVAASGHALVTYHVRPSRRGLCELADHHLRWSTRLGLWRREIRVASRHPVRFYLDVQVNRYLRIKAQRLL